MNLFRAVLEELRVAGCISFFARLHPLINNGVTEEIADTTDRGPTVVIDLRLSDEERRSQLRTLHRRDIAKATRAGCIASVDTNLSNLEAFADIYRDRMRKIGADESYLLNDDYFKTLKEGLTGQLILGTVTLDDRLVGGAIFTLSRDLGFVGYHLSASEELAGGLQPTKLLISYISNWAADEGFHLLHLGGGLGAAEDSLFHFKLGFSPQTRRFRTLQVVLNPETYRDLAAGMDKLSNFFPLYRAPRKEANG